MNECICEGNWRVIIKESEPLFNKFFINEKGTKYRFVGIMHSADDYYYCMMGIDGKLERLSCVGSIEIYGFELSEV